MTNYYANRIVLKTTHQDILDTYLFVALCSLILDIKY